MEENKPVPNNIYKSIESIIDIEKNNGDLKFGKFNSIHEGWAVNYEEIDEYIDELEKIEQKFLIINYQLELLRKFHNKEIWNDIKKDRFDELEKSYKSLYNIGIAAIFELIQAVAMTKKNIDFLEKIPRKSERVKND